VRRLGFSNPEFARGWSQDEGEGPGVAMVTVVVLVAVAGGGQVLLETIVDVVCSVAVEGRGQVGCSVMVVGDGQLGQDAVVGEAGAVIVVGGGQVPLDPGTVMVKVDVAVADPEAVTVLGGGQVLLEPGAVIVTVDTEVGHVGGGCDAVPVHAWVEVRVEHAVDVVKDGRYVAVARKQGQALLRLGT